MAAVAVLKTLTSKDTLIMHLLRCLAFYAAHYGFEIESYHIYTGRAKCGCGRHFQKQSDCYPIHICHSAGHYIHLGRTSSIVCPVAASHARVLSHRPMLSTQTNLFIFENGDPLTRPKLVSHLCQAIALVGLDPKAFSLATVFELVQHQSQQL